MLTIRDLTFSIDGKRLFDGASATIPAGHKVGVVGRNGTGKTTLFRLIRGEIEPEAGEIALPPRARVGGVDQEAPEGPTALLDWVLGADVERARLVAEAETATDATRIAEIQTRLADIDAWSAEARAATILRGLGFTPEEQARPLSEFSGGWRMRVALAGVLFSAPDLLLLDEPTNYLDLEGALWLENFLSRYPHTALVISHDRDLLNRAVGGILHLEAARLTYYAAPYDEFARLRAQRLAQTEAENRKARARIAHLQGFVDRFRYKASKARQAQARLKMIERIELVTPPREAALRALRFPQPDELAPPILRIEGGSVGYDGRAVLSRLDLRIDQDDRIALLGRNGMGKSTLARLLAGRLQPLSGTIARARGLKVGYFAQHQLDELRPEDSPLDHLRRLRPREAPKDLRARLANFGIWEDAAETPAARLSGGQKARLALLIATIDAPHLLILDEPTNHLDIESREALVEALIEYRGAVVIVSHDMHLLRLVADRLWLVGDGTVRPFEDDLEAYRRLLLTRTETPGQARQSRQSRPAPDRRAEADRLRTLRQQVRRAEERVAKLEQMRAKLAERLADPTLYDGGRVAEMEKWQKKFAEVEEALDRAEALWLEAQERLDSAGAAAG